MIGFARSWVILGRTPRCDFQDITHPDDLKADLDLVQRILNGELSSYSIEKAVHTKERSTDMGSFDSFAYL